MSKSLGKRRDFSVSLARGEFRGMLKREAEGLRLKLRYFKAASNGLMKGLKDLVGLPNVA